MQAAAAAQFTLDRSSVARSFDRASAGYDAAAFLHAEVRAELLQRLDLVSLEPRVVVDAGSGTGHACRELKRRYPRARVIALDFAPGMLRAAARQRSWRRRFDRVCADAARMPFADASVDLIFSNLMLPWCDPDAVFAEFRRVLAPRGLLTLTSAGPDTLRELRLAWARADANLHVHPFIDMHDLGDALVRAGFAAPVLDVERRTVAYAGVRPLMADLKAQGARNAMSGRSKSLTGKGAMRAMHAAYEEFRVSGRLPATCEIVFAQAWAPLRAGVRIAGETTIGLADLEGQLRRGRDR